MENFENILGASAKDLRNTRVKNAVRNTESYSYQKVEDAKQEFRNLQSKLDDLLDIGATNTMEIATHLKNFNHQEFVDTLYPLIVEMAVKAREVAIMVNVHNSLFPNHPSEQLDKEDLSILETFKEII